MSSVTAPLVCKSPKMKVADRPVRRKRAAKAEENMSGKGDKRGGKGQDDQLSNLEGKKKTDGWEK